MGNKKEIIPYLRLMLNIQHPPLDDCWMEGYETAGSNIEETANPYPEETKEYQYWLEGWWEGFYKTIEISKGTNIRSDKQNNKISHIPQRKRFRLRANRFSGIRHLGKIMRYVKFSGVIAATFLISYQLIDVIC